jgi:hypothetical protein
LVRRFGPIALIGSGETSLAGGRIFEDIAQLVPQPLRVAILETPAGFELNSPKVAGRVGDFLTSRLQNFNPLIDIIQARKRGTPFSPDEPKILQSLLQANLIFMGPGSPTYAVRQFKGSLAWDLIRARHRLGAALVFASATVIAVGSYALPVYEIYKVGEDVSLVPGLDFFRDFNLRLSLLPHWDNTDGGDEVDTSRCFVGIERFAQWCQWLPPGHTTMGLDEHTGIIFDFTKRKCFVKGVSSVTLLQGCNPEIFPAGTEFSFDELGKFRKPETLQTGISKRAWKMIKNALPASNLDYAPADVIRMAEKRQEARQKQDWALADFLRQQINALGWSVQDTPDRQKIVKQS